MAGVLHPSPLTQNHRGNGRRRRRSGADDHHERCEASSRVRIILASVPRSKGHHSPARRCFQYTDTMIDDDRELDDLTLAELRNQKSQLEKAGWDSQAAAYDAEIESRSDLAETLVEKKTKYRQAKESGVAEDDPAMQALKSEIEELEAQIGDGDGDADDPEPTDAIDDPAEAVDAMAAKIEKFEGVGWDGNVERLRTELAEEGLGETPADKVATKVEWLQRQAKRGDATRVAELVDTIEDREYVASLAEADARRTQSKRNELAALAGAYGVDLSEVGDPDAVDVEVEN